MKTINVICTEFVGTLNQIDVDSRMYDENNSPLIGKTHFNGDDYHLGQISSSFGWAIHDIQNHFKEKLDAKFPEGYKFEFEFVPLKPRSA